MVALCIGLVLPDQAQQPGADPANLSGPVHLQCGHEFTVHNRRNALLTRRRQRIQRPIEFRDGLGTDTPSLHCLCQCRHVVLRGSCRVRSECVASRVESPHGPHPGPGIPTNDVHPVDEPGNLLGLLLGDHSLMGAQEPGIHDSHAPPGGFNLPEH